MAGTSVTALSPDKRRRTMHLGILMGAVDAPIGWSDVFLTSLIIGPGLAMLRFPRSDLLTGLFGASSIYGVRLVAGPARAASEAWAIGGAHGLAPDRPNGSAVPRWQQDSWKGIEMKAADLMTREIVTLGPETPLADAIRLMLDHRVSGLPVVDGTGRLVGLLTEGDLLHRAETGTDAVRLGWLQRSWHAAGWRSSTCTRTGVGSGTS